MQLSKINCSVFRSSQGLSDSSYVLLNPLATPGCLLSGYSAVKDPGVGSQLAARLALEHFIEGVLNSANVRPIVAGQAGEDSERFNLKVIEDAFRDANHSVYELAHKLAAGGRLYASLIGFMIFNGVVSAGRVGNAALYLVRDGEVHPFFVDQNNAHSIYAFERLGVGANSVVNIELSSISLQGGDRIILAHQSLNQESQQLLLRGIKRHDLATLKVSKDTTDPQHLESTIKQSMAKNLSQTVFGANVEMPIFLEVYVEPPAVYLSKQIAVG